MALQDDASLQSLRIDRIKKTLQSDKSDTNTLQQTKKKRQADPIVHSLTCADEWKLRALISGVTFPQFLGNFTKETAPTWATCKQLRTCKGVKSHAVKETLAILAKLTCDSSTALLPANIQLVYFKSVMKSTETVTLDVP